MAIRLDASADYLNRTTNLPAATAWSTCFWFYHIAVNASSSRPYFSNDAGSLTLTSGGNLEVTSFTFSTSGISTSLATGAWHFMALSQVSGTLFGYHRTAGGTWATASIANAPSSLTSQNWGRAGAATWCDARYAAIKFWDVGLTEAEIHNEADTICPRKLDSLNEFWPCFPGATERLAGYSKARNLTGNGTLTDEDPPPVSWGAMPPLLHINFTPQSGNRSRLLLLGVG